MIHVSHTVFDFIQHRDEELAKANPGYDMGNGWIAAPDLLSEFVKYQQEILKQRV